MDRCPSCRERVNAVRFALGMHKCIAEAMRSMAGEQAAPPSAFCSLTCDDLRIWKGLRDCSCLKGQSVSNTPEAINRYRFREDLDDEIILRSARQLGIGRVAYQLDLNL